MRRGLAALFSKVAVRHRPLQQLPLWNDKKAARTALRQGQQQQVPLLQRMAVGKGCLVLGFRRGGGELIALPEALATTVTPCGRAVWFVASVGGGWGTDCFV